MEYLNEHLLPKQLGTAAIVLAFVASLASAVAYFLATQRRDTHEAEGWLKIGRGMFGVHGLSVLVTMGIVFYVMTQQYFEYQYVWAHVDEELPFRYIFSAFWEGQEGSFMLWMFWHIVLGFILIFSAKRFEGPVLFTIALTEMFISTMLLGLHFGDLKIGSNPLLLLRDTMDAPIFALQDYVDRIEGQGLNPLLQNYWMTIHPPTLFLGFAATIVPFGYAVAGLWTGEHKAWLKPALGWSLFTGAILGTGILMGGAWAYEALSFGGYWAWDPVENTSLVPWITLVAGIHTHLVARNTGHSIRATYLFYLLTFILIVYSTTLTRSGVLGDTSVHAFTEMGLEWQLLAFIVGMSALGFGLFAYRYSNVPAPVKEESVSSKEFWMFIGSLVLLFSAVLITASTSLPVFNRLIRLFDPEFQDMVLADPVEHHNKYQLWIGVLIGLLSGAAQFLRWREFNFAKNSTRYFTHLGVALALAALFTWLTSLWIVLGTWQYTLLTFVGWFAVVSNLDYVFSFGRRNAKAAGSAMAHVGFGLLLVGVIASGVNQQHISTNPFEQEGLLPGDMIAKNILMFRDIPMHMSGYRVTYAGDTLIGNERTYDIEYEKLNDRGEIEERFTVHPTATYNNEVNKVAAFNPDTKHYFHKDIFTHVKAMDPSEMDFAERKKHEDSLRYQTFLVPVDQQIIVRDTTALDGKDSMLVRRFRVEILETRFDPTHPDYRPEADDITVGAAVQITHLRDGKSITVHPMLALRGNVVYTFDEQIDEFGIRVRLPQEFLDTVLPREDQLAYERYELQAGEVVEHDGLRFEFLTVSPNATHPQYRPEEGDIAVGAQFRVTNLTTDATARLQPVYLIRNNQPYNLKDSDREIGAHIRFPSLDPQTEKFTFFFAREELTKRAAPVQLALNSIRTDFIILETIVFPGINFFWAGSIFMMLGLAVSMVVRWRDKRKTGLA